MSKAALLVGLVVLGVAAVLVTRAPSMPSTLNADGAPSGSLATVQVELAAGAEPGPLVNSCGHMPGVKAVKVQGPRQNRQALSAVLGALPPASTRQKLMSLLQAENMMHVDVSAGYMVYLDLVSGSSTPLDADPGAVIACIKAVPSVKQIVVPV